jgi:type I restriction enzyme S subunit
MTGETRMRLSDLCDFVAVQVDPATRADDVYVGLEHIAPGRFVTTSHGKASDVQSAKYAFQAGDVLYGKLRPYLDKAVLAQDVGICTTELLVLRPKECVDPRFLVSVVHAPSFVKYAVSGTTGVQHPRTSWTHIRDFELPDFASDEQAKIANLLWEVHDTIVANEAVIEAGADLKRAAMRALFTKGLRGEAQKETEIGPVPESWGTPTVAEAVLPFRFDRSKQVAKSAYLDAGEWPIIDQGQQDIAGYTDDLEKVISHTQPIIIFGDHTRAFKFVGFPFALGADGAKPLLAREGIDARFLFQALCALDVPSRGYNRHYTILSEMCLPMPPTIDEQREIVAILDAIDRKIDLHRRKRAVLDELFKALLHKLMTGEIRVADLDLSALSAPPEATAA